MDTTTSLNFDWNKVISILNINDIKAVQMYEEGLNAHWNDVEFDYHVEGFEALPESERLPLEKVLTCFAGFDGLVADTLLFRMLRAVEHKEQKDLYIQNTNMETIHGRTYTKLVQGLIHSTEKQKEIMTGVEKYQSIVAQANFINSIIDMPDNEEVFFRLACAECIFFCPLFAIIFYYNYAYNKSKIDFSVLDKTNQLIARDESGHYKTHIHFMNYYGGIEYNKMKRIVKEAVALATMAAIEILEGSSIDVSVDDLKKYIELQANRLCGMCKIYGSDDISVLFEVVDNPLLWMKNIETVTKTNFFEIDNMNYHVNVGVADKDIEFGYDIDC